MKKQGGGRTLEKDKNNIDLTRQMGLVFNFVHCI